MSWARKDIGWTQEQDHLLLALGTSVSNDEAALRVSRIGPARTSGATRLRRHKLGCGDGRVRWSAEDEAALARLWPDGVSPAEIGVQLGGFSARAVSQRASKLGLRSRGRAERGPKPGVKSKALTPVRKAQMAVDSYERDFVVAKRAARVSWAHIATMLKKPEMDLRARYGR